MSPRSHPVVSVLGVHISALPFRAAVDAVVAAAADDRAREYVTVTGVHGVMECQEDPALLDAHNRAALCTADGMPMVWASRWAGVRDAERAYGPDLTEALAAEAGARGWSIYCIGGPPGLAERFGRTLEQRHPGLRLAGSHSPPFSDDVVRCDREVIDAVNRSGARLLFVGLSTPKQERWMALHRELLDVPVMIGVGAAFDFVTGGVRQAPRWMQRSGLEWLFRLAMEPRRLFRRYARNNPRFLLQVLRRPPRPAPVVAGQAVL